MSTSSNRWLSKTQKIGLLFLLALVVGVALTENFIEKKAAEAIEKYVHKGDIDVDYTLLINQLRLRIPDTTYFDIEGQTKIKFGRGTITGCGLKILKYLRSSEIAFGIIEVSSTDFQMNHEGRKDTLQGQPSTLSFSTLRFSFDTMSVSWKNKEFSTREVRFEIENIDFSDSNQKFELARLEAQMLQFLDSETVEAELEMIDYQGPGKIMLISKGRIDELERNSNNRVRVSTRFDSILIYDLVGTHRDSQWSIGSAVIRELDLNIRQIKERPLCDGRDPCIQKVMSNFLMDLPVRDSLFVDGHLDFKHLSSGSLESHLWLNEFQGQFKYSRNEENIESESNHCRVQIKAVLNDGVKTNLEGRFGSEENFNYEICTAPFTMSTLNSVIPKQSDFSVKIEDGSCQHFCMNVNGIGRQSVANFDIQYEGLDIELIGAKRFKGRALKMALPLMTNESFDSKEKSIVHEESFAKDRTFFYQMGQHVNFGFKNAIVKSWVRRD